MKENVFWDEKILEEICSTTNIVLIANVQEPRGYKNAMQLQCNTTERFSVEEFNEIYQGIVTAGFYIQNTYFNELDFIADYTVHSDRFKNSFVFNLARNGKGNNKKTIIPSFCELVGIPYTTSSSMVCAVCRNKYFFSSLLALHEIPVPQSWYRFSSGAWLKGYPNVGEMVICKPSSESASQGINENSIFKANMLKFDVLPPFDYVIQQYIDGDECEVPIFKFDNHIHVLSPVGINLKNKKIIDEKASTEYAYSFYPFTDKYDSDTISSIKNYAKKAFELLQMDVYGRIDFRVDKNGKPYVFDISTTPYTIKHSSFSFAFQKLGYSYSDIYKAIICATVIQYQKDKNCKSDKRNPLP